MQDGDFVAKREPTGLFRIRRFARGAFVEVPDRAGLYAEQTAKLALDTLRPDGDTWVELANGSYELYQP